MGSKRAFYGALCAAVLLLVAVSPVSAQSIMYMDKSGNLNFVDTVQEIPREYRDQVLEEEAVQLEIKEYNKYVQKQNRAIQKQRKTAMKKASKAARRKDAKTKKKTKKQKKGKQGAPSPNEPPQQQASPVLQGGGAQPQFLDD